MEKNSFSLCLSVTYDPKHTQGIHYTLKSSFRNISPVLECLTFKNSPHNWKSKSSSNILPYFPNLMESLSELLCLVYPCECNIWNKISKNEWVPVAFKEDVTAQRWLSCPWLCFLEVWPTPVSWWDETGSAQSSSYSSDFLCSAAAVEAFSWEVSITLEKTLMYVL